MELFPSRTIALYTVRLLLIRSFAFLAGLVVILRRSTCSASRARSWRSRQQPCRTVAYVGLRAPQLIALFLPFSVLLGTLVTLAR